MAEKSVMVRVRESTRARLQAEVARIMRAVEDGRREDPGINPEQINPCCPGLSLDALINLMLDQVDAHRERDRRHRAKKRKRPPAESGE